MITTQDHIPIRNISDDIVYLKDGGGALVLQVSAVNFGLLSQREQMAIIASFAQMLNSLSFSIQIVIYSKRLNIASYLALLEKAKKAQTNPLLSKMIISYEQFIQTLIKENEVLDKKFFLIIPLFKLELGITSSKERLDQKVKTVLLPRRDHVIRQLQRAGLGAQQLNSQKLIELFFEIYNGVESSPPDTRQPKPPPSPITPITPPRPAPPQAPIQPPVLPTSQTQSQPSLTWSQPNMPKSHPFVVEELEEG